jgi:histidinol phosphatase-like PHP family hydrolase
VTLFDHHVHTDRSDGTKSLADRAASTKVRPHGVSDHFPWALTMETEYDVLRYVDDAARLGLRVGLEYDLGVAPPLRAATRDALHYMIGAVHQLEIAPGEWIEFDSAGAYLKGRTTTFASAARFLDADLQARVRDRYLDVVRLGIERDGIDILGHPTMGPLAALGDPERVFPAEWQERLIELCVTGEVAIELNECYGVPHREFLERARRRGARFSVGTDSHFAIGPIDKTMAMIRDAGLDAGRFLAGSRVRTVRE